ncbi:AMP-binding protein [Nocardia africana]
MTDQESLHAHALIAERTLPTDQVWAAAERRLDRPITAGLNTAHEACDRWARDRARIAVVMRHPDGRTEHWTFAELARVSSRLATAWRSAGIQRGDRVAAVVTQQIEAYICALAAWRSGVIYMPLFVGFAPDALAERLNSADVAAIVVDHRYREGVEKAQSMLIGDPRIYTVVGNDGRGLLHGDRSLWSEIDRHAALAGVADTAASDAATLIFTSGTTGAPKGCVQPHSVLLTLQPFVRHVLALSPSDLLFTGANPGWTYGLYTTGFAVMALGHPRVIYTGDFDPHAWSRVIEDEQPTYLAAAPSAYRRLARTMRFSGLPSSVRGATSAGEPLDVHLGETWLELTGATIQDGYGQSESAMLLADLAFGAPAVAGALSSAVPGFEVGLVDAEGRQQDEEGIIAVRRPRYLGSTGFWNAQEQWEARWRDDWFLTGDRARRDDEGRWWFLGRDDDLIVTAGYNVGPTEVENILLSHPGVAEAAVVAAPDPDRGSVVRAFLVASGAVAQDRVEAEIKENVRARIGRHAAPKIVDFVDELPRTETGKIRRNILRQSPS